MSIHLIPCYPIEFISYLSVITVNNKYVLDFYNKCPPSFAVHYGHESVSAALLSQCYESLSL